MILLSLFAILFHLPNPVFASEHSSVFQSFDYSGLGENKDPEEKSSTCTSPFFHLQLAHDDSCTATWISDDGYALTALHCVIGQFHGSNYYDSNYHRVKRANAEITDPIPGTHESATTIDKSKLPMLANDDLDNLEVQIIAVGAKGVLSPMTQDRLNQNYPDSLKQLLSDGYNGIGGDGDFALIKVNTPPGLAPSPAKNTCYPAKCVRLSDRPMAKNENLLGLSFPQYTRKDGTNSASDPRVSAGKVTDISREGSLISYGDSNQEIVNTSVDAESGSSGSSVIDPNGRVRGILVSVAKPDSVGADYYPGTRVIPISHILASLRKDLGEKFVDNLVQKGCSYPKEAQEVVAKMKQVTGQESRLVSFQRVISHALGQINGDAKKLGAVMTGPFTLKDATYSDTIPGAQQPAPGTDAR